MGLNRAIKLADDDTVATVLSFGYPAKKKRDPRSRSAQQWIDAANRKPYDEVVREV